MASFDNITSTPLPAHNEDTAVTIDIGDESCHYDYNIASFNTCTPSNDDSTVTIDIADDIASFNSATSSLNSSSTINYAEDRSITIPKTVLKKNANILVV
jgi:hypothetical protein